MSRPWSRFAFRASAVSLLLVGVIGGTYLGENRQDQRVELDAAAVAEVDSTEQAMMRDYLRDRSVLLSGQRAAEQAAAEEAADAAKAAAERAGQAEQAASRKRAEARAAKEAEESAPDFGPIPSSCKEYSGNRGIGCALLLDAGFKLDQMTCLDKLWTKESHWNEKASNGATGAYGIPQAVPGSKMASVAADWQTNPATQITWGLGYIKGRYDTPCGAWQQSESAGWY